MVTSLGIVDPQTFFDNFALFADAPNGALKLRELILQLAIGGKLVDQVSSDEPACVLLEKIKIKQQRLVEKGFIKEIKVRPLDTLNGLELPNGWEWTRLGSIAAKLGAGSTPLGGRNVYQRDGVKFLRSQNVWNDRLRLDTVAHISETIHNDMSGTQVEAGDILLNITGASIGRSCVVPNDLGNANVSQHVSIVRLIDKELRFFIHLCLISPYVQDSIMRTQVGISREGLSMKSLKDFRLPIPPLEEQKRIVSKVDELMRLCDELDERQQRRRESRVRLNDVTLAPLNSAASLTPAGFKQASVRLADSFATLYNSVETVGKLRSTILQLAIQGHLVPQDPFEVDASELLKEIEIERQVTARRKKLKLKTFVLSAPVASYFPLPPKWQTEALGNLVEAERSISYGVLVPGADMSEGIPFVRVQDLAVHKPEIKPSKKIDPEIEQQYARTRLKGGEILLGVVGSIGKIGVAPETWAGANIARAVGRIATHHAMNRDYLVIALQSPHVQNYFFNATRTLAQPTLNVSLIELAPIPIPPLAEQKRIVAKVNLLMSLCYELEGKLRQAEADSENLMNAGVRQLLRAVSQTASPNGLPNAPTYKHSTDT